MAALVLAAVLAPCASRAADAPPPLSYTQVQALSEADLIKLVVEQAASFIETAPPGRYNANLVATTLKIDAPPTPALLAAAVREKLAALTSGLAAYHLQAQDKGATRQQLRRIELWTKPYATAVSSLCGSEMLMLEYRWDPKADADTPVKMNGLSVSLRYYALKSPASPVAVPVTAAGLKAGEAACQALNPLTQDFAYAFDAQGAWTGLWVKDRIDAALKQTVLPFELACADGTQADQCRQTFEGYMKNFSDIRPCSAQTCTLGVNHGLRDAVATLDLGPVPKIRNVTLNHIMPPVLINRDP